MQRLGSTLVSAAGVIVAGWAAAAKEYPIGAPQENGMEIGAVYLQPIEMDPPDMCAGERTVTCISKPYQGGQGQQSSFAQRLIPISRRLRIDEARRQ